MDKKKQPLVSVLMCVYNEEEWVDYSINSILNQTYKNIEVIVINDGSSDSTLKKLISLSKKYSSLKIFTQKNQGLTISLNIGLKKCKGEYIARMDADNFSDKCRIEKQVNFLEKNADYSLVGSWRKEINEQGKIFTKRFPIEDNQIKQWLIRACVISHSSIMIRSNVIKKYLYDENFRTSQDYDLWVRMAKSEKFYNLPQYLTTAYLRKTSVTRTKKKFESFKTKFIIHKKALKNIKHPLYRKVWLLKPFYEFVK